LPPTSKRYPPTYSPDTFWAVTVLLLQNPQFNSSHLFRADVLWDSGGVLEPLAELGNGGGEGKYGGEAKEAGVFEGWELRRTVVRRLVPRNPRLDRRMEQTGHFYRKVAKRKRKSEGGEGAGVLSGGVEGSAGLGGNGGGDGGGGEEEEGESCLVVYTPHVEAEDQIPWYHPSVRALAYLYEWNSASTAAETGDISSSTKAPDSASHSTPERIGSLSLHILPFSPSTPITDRLHRTALALLTTFHRIASSPNPNPSPPQPAADPSSADPSKQHTPNPIQLALNPSKDGLIPRHRLQDTYTALKLRYATALIEKWVEKTEPSKHVFEDLGIAAFLIELWRGMYGVFPKFEREVPQEDSMNEGDGIGDGHKREFPGFVDVACGNGVLTHVLLEEGYSGYGFDARMRKTWEAVFPESTQRHLLERICVPKPFLEALKGDGKSTGEHVDMGIPDDMIHDGVFPPGTFIISNHADELTPWTPILAALSQVEMPLPFLAIPCCSHALSGARNRYKVPNMSHAKTPGSGNTGNEDGRPKDAADEAKAPAGPETGDLKVMRVEKQKIGGASSAYQALTAHTVWLALQLGYQVDTTLLRIPSTRNVGVVCRSTEAGEERKGIEKAYRDIVERECGGKRDDGVREAAMVWIDRIKGLRKGQGRGKLNLHCERNEINGDGHNE
jgi:tRNASer (uridine44-2'-O)-methyltransferase